MSFSCTLGCWNRLYGWLFIYHTLFGYIIIATDARVKSAWSADRLWLKKNHLHLVSWMVKLTGTLGLYFEAWRTVSSDSSVLIFMSTLGKEHSAKPLTAKWFLSSATSRALGKEVAESQPHSANLPCGAAGDGAFVECLMVVTGQSSKLCRVPDGRHSAKSLCLVHPLWPLCRVFFPMHSAKWPKFFCSIFLCFSIQIQPKYIWI